MTSNQGTELTRGNEIIRLPFKIPIPQPSNKLIIYFLKKERDKYHSYLQRIKRRQTTEGICSNLSDFVVAQVTKKNIKMFKTLISQLKSWS